MRCLSDADTESIRAAVEAGRSTASVAAEHGVSVRQVQRIVAGQQHARLALVDADAPGPVAAALDAYLGGLRLDSETAVVAQVCKALAGKLDSMADARSAAAANAMPAIARQLAELLAVVAPDEDERARIAFDLLIRHFPQRGNAGQTGRAHTTP